MLRGDNILLPEFPQVGAVETGLHFLAILTQAGPRVAGLGVQVWEGAVACGVCLGQQAGAGPQAGGQA